MILIFDLDDTLYPEITFVKSGFKEVSKILEKELIKNKEKIYFDLINIMRSHGRGKIFDIYLKNNNKYSKKLLKKCITAYRFHNPDIKLYPEAINFLRKNKKVTYLVTDGNKIVQKNKVKALKIDTYIARSILTHQFGLKYSKPSTFCFELIKKKENCSWKDIVYVGDNPLKDFVELNKKGACTVRVLTGGYAHLTVPSDFNAKCTIPTLRDLPGILEGIMK